MTVEIATQSSDVSSTLESISAETAITAQYAQGATNLYAMQASDNADASHPAVMNFYVPTACAKINQVLLSWKLENFRAYETGAAAGGGDVRTTQEGGGSTPTSEAGGATTVSVPQRTVAQAITSGTPMQDGTVNANTSFAKSIDGGNVSDTGSSSGTTGAGGGGNTGVEPERRRRDDLDGRSREGTRTALTTRTGTPSTAFPSARRGIQATTARAARPAPARTATAWVTGTALTATRTALGGHRHGMIHRHEFSHYHEMNISLLVPSQTLNLPEHTAQRKHSGA